jgi:endonuclease III-like uncharacterized protein
MHIFCTYTQKWMQREKKDSKNKTKRLRGDTDTRLHQVIREKGFLFYRTRKEYLKGLIKEDSGKS